MNAHLLDRMLRVLNPGKRYSGRYRYSNSDLCIIALMIFTATWALVFGMTLVLDNNIGSANKPNLCADTSGSVVVMSDCDDLITPTPTDK